MKTFETFTLEKIGGVGIVKINRPKAVNTLTNQLFDEIQLVTKAIEDDPELLCIVLTGEGKHFCGGIDISLLAEVSPEWSVRNVNKLHARLHSWENMTQPIIAAINGACMGGGFELALCCDIRIAAADAVFAVPEVSFDLSLTGYGRQPTITKDGWGQYG